MSHLRKCKVEIKNPNVALLKQAVEEIAKEMNITTDTEVRSYEGTKTKVLIGLTGYYGVQINDGQLEVVGDDYQKNFKLPEFANQVNNQYVAAALRFTMARQGYRVQTQKKEQKIYLYGTAA